MLKVDNIIPFWRSVIPNKVHKYLSCFSLFSLLNGYLRKLTNFFELKAGYPMLWLIAYWLCFPGSLTCFLHLKGFPPTLSCLQVHHGGAGTTAAGLKAAVMASHSKTCLFLAPRDWLLLTFIVSVSVSVSVHSSAQPRSFLSLEINRFGANRYMLEELVLHPSPLKSSHLTSWWMP